MTENTEQLSRKVEVLQAERDALAAELERLRAGRDATADLTAWVAWDEAEALLAELIAIDPAAESGVLPEVLHGEAAVLHAREAVPPERAVAERRRRLEAIRDVVRDRDRRLLELQRQKDEILSIVAHDLRTPLVAIQGFAQLLQLSRQAAGLTAKQAEYVERIFQAVRSMNLLVEDLLTTRQLEQGRLSLRPRVTEVGPFVRDLVDLHGEAARQKGVEIRVACPPDAPSTVFDPDRLAQALGNLLQNAVKFTPQGRVVTVEVAAGATALRFAVSDQGPGIDEELLPGLFDRFCQGRIVETAGRGYGLGLFICREIAELHGGGVGAENVPNGGSRFWIELPRTSPAAGETGEGEPA